MNRNAAFRYRTYPCNDITMFLVDIRKTVETRHWHDYLPVYDLFNSRCEDMQSPQIGIIRQLK